MNHCPTDRRRLRMRPRAGHPGYCWCTDCEETHEFWRVLVRAVDIIAVAGIMAALCGGIWLS